MMHTILEAKKEATSGLTVSAIAKIDRDWVAVELRETEAEDRKTREGAHLIRDLISVERFIKLEKMKEPKAIIIIDDDDNWFTGT